MNPVSGSVLPLRVADEGAGAAPGDGAWAWGMAGGAAAGAGAVAALLAAWAGHPAVALFALFSAALCACAAAQQARRLWRAGWSSAQARAAQQNAANAEAWRALAQQDAVTGLANRRCALAQLERGAGSGGALLLLRVADLDGLNRRIGRAATDRLLATVGELLAGHPKHIEGAWAARLHAADFLLWLPRQEPAAETCAALLAALQSTWRALASGVEAHGAVLRWQVGALAVPQLLEQAEALLAQAELGAPFTYVLDEPAGPAPDTASAAAVKKLTSSNRVVFLQTGPAAASELEEALRSGAAQLRAYPVCNASGSLVHWQCPMHLKLGGAWWPAQAWLPLAARKGVAAQADLLALTLALQACAEDGASRAVHVADASLPQPGFAQAVADTLAQAPKAVAQRLWLRVGEGGALRRPARLLAAAQMWRATGARLMLEHAAGSLLPPHLLAATDALSLDARFVRGLAGDAALQAFMQSLVATTRWQRLPLFAEGVDEGADLDALWALGVAAATGPVVTQRFGAAAAAHAGQGSADVGLLQGKAAA